MNKIRYMILAFFMVLLVGCTNNTIPDYEVAIIESTSNMEKSLVTYYDENLEKVGTKFLPYAELGSNFYSPVYYEDEVYIVPRGLQGKHDEKKVISLNLNTGEETKYKVDKYNILCTAANDEYVFAGSNSNAVSYLTRTSFKDGTTKELAFKNEYLSLITASDKYVFTFLSSAFTKSNQTKLNIYESNTLKLKKSIDITDYGMDIYKCYLDQDKLYFSISRDKNDEPINKLGILDINDFSLSQVELLHDYPNDIQKISDNRLLISCSDIVLSEGTHVIIYDIDTGEQKSYDLEVPIMNIATKENKLYVLGSNHNLYVYDIENDMKLIKSIEHELTEGIYCSNLFLKSK